MAVACVRRPRLASRGMRSSPIPREAGTCVTHDVAGGNERATVARSAGDGARAAREGRACLGRVVDRARGACRSRARGLFPCDLTTGEFGPAPEGVGGPRRRNARAARPTRAVSFGDAFPLDSFLRPGGLMACADACGHAEPDAVRAPLASCVPAGLANRHAGDCGGPPARGSPAPGPGWPPRGPASAWPTSAARTPSAASWASAWPSSAGGGRRPQAGAPTASSSTPRGRPTPAAFPSRPSPTTTARPARRSASPASRSATRACPSSSATSPAT